MVRHLRTKEEIACAILRAGLRADGVDSSQLYRLIISCISRYYKDLVVPLLAAGYMTVEKRELARGRPTLVYRTTQKGREFYEKYNAMLDMIRTPGMRIEIERVHGNINLFNEIFLG